MLVLPQPSTAAGAAARPSRWQHCLWLAGMWVTILHAALLGPIFVWEAAKEFGPAGLEDVRFAANVRVPVKEKIAYFLAQTPTFAAVACLLTAPLAVVGCYLRSKGKRGWRWMLAYWLLAGILWLVPTIATSMLPFEGWGGDASLYALPSFTPNWLLNTMERSLPLPWGLVDFLIRFLPLPVTLAVAVLAFGGKKDSAPRPHPFGG